MTYKQQRHAMDDDGLFDGFLDEGDSDDDGAADDGAWEYVDDDAPEEKGYEYAYDDDEADVEADDDRDCSYGSGVGAGEDWDSADGYYQDDEEEDGSEDDDGGEESWNEPFGRGASPTKGSGRNGLDYDDDNDEEWEYYDEDDDYDGDSDGWEDDDDSGEGGTGGPTLLIPKPSVMLADGLPPNVAAILNGDTMPKERTPEEGGIDQWHGLKGSLRGEYGKAFFSIKPSEEMLQKEEQRFFHKDAYSDVIADAEAGLCEKYGIVPPTKYSNTRGDRGTNGEQLLIMGATANDKRNPKLWGIRQEDRTRHTWCLGGTGSGKQISNDMLILTLQGWKKIGDIEYTDLVYTRNGALSEIIDISSHPRQPVWELELADGQIIEAHAEHRWFVIRSNHGQRKEYVKTTEELYEEGIRNHEGRGFKNRIPLCQPIQFSNKILPISPYALGCLIGDGCLIHANDDSLKYSCAEDELLGHVANALGNQYELVKQCVNPNDYSYYIHEKDDPRITKAPTLSEVILKLGLDKRSEHKFIPDIYKNASVEQRRELLKGLMDTDGTASKGRFRFTTISETLKDDFKYLCRSLGYQVRERLDARSEKYPNSNGNCWIVSILANDVENLFKLQRKKDAFYKYRAQRSDFIRVVAKKNATLLESDFNSSNKSDLRPEDLDFVSSIPATHLTPYLAGIMSVFPTSLQQIFVPANIDTPHMRARIEALIPDIKFYTNSNSAGTKLFFTAEGPIQANHRPCNRILHECRAAGLKVNRKEQHIPAVYKQATLAERLAFIQGMSDGRGKIYQGRLEFHTSYQKMLDDMTELFESCGYATEIVPVSKTNSTQIFRVLNPDAGCISDPDKLAELAKQLNTSLSALLADIPECTWISTDVLALSEGDTMSSDASRSTVDAKRSEFTDGIPIVDIRPTDRYADMTCISVADESESYIIENFTVTHNSTLLHALGVEDMWYWRGGLMLEPHGDLAAGLLRCAPPYRIHDIIYLNVLDPEYSPGFNPLEIPPGSDEHTRHEAVGSVTSLIAKHFNMESGMVKLRKMLENALNALVWCPGATLLEVLDFYSNEDLRQTVLSFMPDGPLKDGIADTAENAKADDLGSLENRMSQFVNNRYMKHLFGQSHSTMNFYDLMNQGAYIICPISKGGTTDDTFLKFYGSYVVSEVYKSAVMREAIEEKKRVNFALTLDEFQNFISDDIEGILAEARKYGLMLGLANQYIAQLGPTIEAAVIQNCATKLCYALGPTDAPKLAKAFGNGITAADMQAIPKYHVMASPLINGGNVRPFISAVFPPIELKNDMPTYVIPLIEHYSRVRYMKKRSDIDAEINERKEKLASGNREAVIELMTKKNK